MAITRLPPLAEQPPSPTGVPGAPDAVHQRWAWGPRVGLTLLYLAVIVGLVLVAVLAPAPVPAP